MQLDKLQSQFMDFLYSPRTAETKEKSIRELFLSPQRPDPIGGLKVYRRNLIFGLSLAMKETYGFCHALLGEKNFYFFCREYIYANPSTNGDVTCYGEGFGDFLSRRQEIQNFPFMEDIARLEWARDRAFYSPSRKAIPFGKLADYKSGTSGLKFRLKPSLSLIQTRWRVYESWIAYQRGGLEALPENPFPPGRENIMVWEEEGTPRESLIDPENAGIIERLLSRENGSLPLPLHSPAFLFLQGWVTEGE